MKKKLFLVLLVLFGSCFFINSSTNAFEWEPGFIKYSCNGTDLGANRVYPNYDPNLTVNVSSNLYSFDNTAGFCYINVRKTERIDNYRFYSISGNIKMHSSIIKDLAVVTANKSPCLFSSTPGADNFTFFCPSVPPDMNSNYTLYQIAFSYNSTSSATRNVRTSIGYSQYFTADLVNEDSVSIIAGVINSSYNNINNQISDFNNTQQETNNKLDTLNDSITSSDSIDDSGVSNMIDGFNNALPGNNTISSLMTMPITLLQTTLNGFSGSCKPYNFGNFLGSDLIFPCINIGSSLGIVWTIIDIICSGMIIFAFGKSLIKIYQKVTRLDNVVDDVISGGGF